MYTDTHRNTDNPQPQIWQCPTVILIRPIVEMVHTSCPDVIINPSFHFSLQTMLTAISMSAIATNGVVPGKYLDNDKSQQFYHNSRLHHLMTYFLTRTSELYFYDLNFFLNVFLHYLPLGGSSSSQFV